MLRIMLKDLILERGQSVYAVSKGSKIAYTTLNELVNGKKNVSDCSIKTIYALADYFGVSIDSLYKIMLGQPDASADPRATADTEVTGVTRIAKINQTWQEKRYKKYKFPVIQGSGNYDASRIHPLKQKLVFAISEKLQGSPYIESLILFGSSTTIRCNNKSDVDFAIRLKPEFNDIKVKGELSEQIQELASWKSDIIWLDRVQPGSKLDNNIKRGVKIL